MWHFLKKKKAYNLEWVEVDMHAHWLPGIDDGCKSIEDSVACIQALASIGLQQFIATPHIMPQVYENTSSSIASAFDEWKNAVRHQGLQHLDFSFAAEHMVSEEMISNPNFEFAVLADKYVLIEMSYLARFLQLEQVIYHILLQGYIPVLAHPERYGYLHDNWKYFGRLKEIGCLLQANILSFSGYYGKTVQQTAEQLAQQGWYDFLGTDMHHWKHVQQILNLARNKDLRYILRKCAIKNISLAGML